MVALQQTARPTTLRFGGICVLVPLRCFSMIVPVVGASKTVLGRLMRGLGSRAPVGCCLSREGLAVAGRDWIVAAGAVALADASPQMTSLRLEGTVCFLFERLSDALRLGVVGSTGGWRRLGGQRVRFRAERLLRGCMAGRSISRYCSSGAGAAADGAADDARSQRYDLACALCVE